MKKILILTLIIFTGFQSFAQKKSKGISFSLQVGSENEIEKPKLVVGIVVDQMRYDYIWKNSTGAQWARSCQKRQKSKMPKFSDFLCFIQNYRQIYDMHSDLSCISENRSNIAQHAL